MALKRSSKLPPFSEIPDACGRIGAAGDGELAAIYYAARDCANVSCVPSGWIVRS
jgi:hypothetical protein